MSNPKQALPSGANAGGEWDEAKLEAALKNLKELHIKAKHFFSSAFLLALTDFCRCENCARPFLGYTNAWETRKSLRPPEPL